MELTCAKCRSILETLPIGYYAGRRITVELKDNEATSYYSPMEDKIVVSYPIIAERLAQVADGTCSPEEAVRSMLYHEVSHAILTPAKHLVNNTAVNIFEDERIETVLQNYYMDVNFKQQLYDIHGGKPPKAVDKDTAFFNAVRFGLGTPQVQKEIERLLDKYKGINRNTPRYGYDIDCYEYQQDIAELYSMITKNFAKSPQSYQPKGGSGKEQPKQMDRMKQNQESGSNQQSDDGQGDVSGETVMTSNSDTDDDNQNDTKQVKVIVHKNNMSDEAVKELVKEGLDRCGNLSQENKDKVHEFQRTVETIIGNFNKKNSGGSGINTYSGVFNPRAVVRKDYRFFERSMSTNGNNKYGTCHLNLVIDCSGSFSDNEKLTNALIASLSEVERKYKNFSMDVAFINEQLRLCQSVAERSFHATGGNKIPDETKEVLRKLQKPQTCNYNIILFDGDALSDDRSAWTRGAEKFRIFDMKQTTLITDPDNTRYMEEPFTSTKVIITRSYTAELIDHIIHALYIAFG